MRCPHCRDNDDKVVDSRLADDGGAIRRRRECLACGRRFTTYERVEDVSLVVRKRSGVAEPFDRAKLRAGIERAATGRLDDPAVDTAVADIEEELRALGSEVSSDRVGIAVLDRLRALDHVGIEGLVGDVVGVSGRFECEHLLFLVALVLVDEDERERLGG